MDKARFKTTSMESINSTRKGSSRSSCEDLSTNFKARPASVLRRDPFIPAPSYKEPTVPEPFQLESERRRLDRLAFHEEQRKKMEMIQRIQREREEAKIAAEKEEIAKIRKLTETKAIPIPKYKPMVIHPSNKKLTEPKSPTDHRKCVKKTNKENVPSNHN